jgi:hypothetical protein
MANLLNNQCLHNLKKVSLRLGELEKDTENIESDARRVRQDINKIRTALDKLFLGLTKKKGVSNEQDKQDIEVVG